MILTTSLFTLAMLASGQGAAADLIIRGGDILTMAGDQPSYAQALAVKGGRITAVGSEAEVMRMRTDSTRVLDLGGKTLLPGFLDGHSHYINSLLVANQCKLYAPPSGPGKDVPSIIAELKRFASERKVKKGEMIIGYGYDDTVMPNGRLLNRDDLDKAFPDNPVRIDHVSMHGTVMNSLALKKYGYSSATKTPPGGVIVRKPGTQEPYGLIMETAFLPVLDKQEPMTAAQEIEWTRAGQMLYAEAGITTAHEGATHLPQYQTMKRASDAGANIIDVIAYPFITDLEKILAKQPRSTWTTYKNRFKLGGVKITLDGSPQGRTALFSTPYLKGGPGGEKNWVGEPTFPEDLVKKAFKRVYELGLPLNAHCNGDGAIDLFLRAYEHARGGDFSKPWNVTTIHTQFLRKDHIPKFVEYKVRPSFYTLHTYYFADAHYENRGKRQADYLSPMRDAIDAGLRPSNHTDFVVAPLDQMMVLWSAVNRKSRGGKEIGLDQRITPYEGLKALTEWPAEQYGEQAIKGTLEVGKLADLVILDKNPLKVDPDAIKGIKVVRTMKEGSTIFPADPNDKVKVSPQVRASKQSYSWRVQSCCSLDLNTAADRTWVLSSLNGKYTTKSNPPTMKFSKGRLQAFGGVNRLSGSYALVGDRVVLGELVSTKMAGPQDRMALESRVVKALKTVNSFQVHGNTLKLYSNGNLVAVFRTASGGSSR